MSSDIFKIFLVIAINQDDISSNLDLIVFSLQLAQSVYHLFLFLNVTIPFKLKGLDV